MLCGFMVRVTKEPLLQCPSALFRAKKNGGGSDPL